MWTLTSHGKTEKAFATLKPDYFMDDIVIMNNNGAGGAGGGSPDTIGNKAPALKVEGEKTRHVKVGEPVALTALASDDGKPEAETDAVSTQSGGRERPRHPQRRDRSATLLVCVPGRQARSASIPPRSRSGRTTGTARIHRGPQVGPAPPVPPEGKWVSRATFSDPGTYVLRCLAHDGGLMTSEDVTFVVNR